MTLKDIRNRMSVKHEEYVAEELGSKRNLGSGNQARKQMDGRQDYRELPYAFAWDCKATLGNSISVTKDMWKKATQQAGDEFPMLPLRFYEGERLANYTDLAVIDFDLLKELIDIANGVE